MDMISNFVKLMNLQTLKKLLELSKGFHLEVFKITILSILSSIISVLMAFITKRLIDFAVGKNQEQVMVYGLIFALAMILDMGISSYSSYRSVRVTEILRNDLELRTLEMIFGKRLLEINTFRTGDLLNRISSDVGDLVSVYTSTIPKLIALMLQLLMAFAFLFYYDGLLAMLAFLVTPVALILSLFIGHKQKLIQTEIQKISSVKKSIINESLQNILILKVYEYLSTCLENIAKLQRDRYQLVKKKNNISIKAFLLMESGFNIGFFATILIGAVRLMQSAISFGTFTAFLQLIGQVQGPILGLSKSVPQIISTLSSVERLSELEELTDDHLAKTNNEIDLCETESIELKGVQFSYDGKVDVLRGLDLEIKQGEKIAVVGPSGAGKTTLTQVLLALIVPHQGDLNLRLADGNVIRLDANTRKFFAYVSQSNALFSGTLYSNFLLKEPASDEIIEKALIASCCKEFVDSLPEGVHSHLGERGIGLSQGQAQRLTIARALIHNKPFLIFDEATSSLDLETETQLIENLRLYYPRMTLIAITHRESIFNICDKVYKLQNGQLTQVWI